MIFTVFPEDSQNAEVLGKYMSEKLKMLDSYGISPIVVVEPYEGENLVDYEKFIDSGVHSQRLTVFFKTLREEGVTDKMMGTWVPFPESNTPNWGIENGEPRDFAHSVNKYLEILKTTFPYAKGSVLLNSATYKANDINWDNGDYLNFTPYLVDIDEDLVDSFGIQGFPWIADASREGEYIFNAEEFLQPFLAISGAKELRVKDIWINTGVFRTKYAHQEEREVQLTPMDRRAILNDIVRQVQLIQEYQENAYRVSVNMFLADKSDSNEATDWSFLKTEGEKDIFREFVRRLRELDVKFSLYDGR